MTGFPFNSIEEYLLKSSGNMVVFGMGGGGDVVGAYHIYSWFKRLKRNVYLGAVPWERYVSDPVPGPIPIEKLENSKMICENVAVGNSETYALRKGRKIYPQASLVAKALNIDVLFFDASKGEKGLRLAFNELRKSLNVDLVIGVDVGGDVLAIGEEKNLWSPLMDNLSASALYNSDQPTIVAVHGLNSDGELSLDQLLKRLSKIANERGVIGVHGLSRSDLDSIEKILSLSVTEASRAPYEAMTGVFCVKEIRQGTRKITINPVLIVTYLIDTKILYTVSPIPQIIKGTGSIGEANEKLNKLGLYTELDLERDVYKEMRKGRKIEEIDIVGLREKGLAHMNKSIYV